MKCPIDQTEMENGELRGDPKWGVSFYPERHTSIFGGDVKLVVYRCPKCGKVELTTEVK